MEVPKEILKQIIVEWKKHEPKKLIARDLPFKYKENKANIIVGPRRVGKTYFLFQLIHSFKKKDCFYINFEDERIYDSPRFLTDILPAIKELYSTQDIILFLDEIQNISSYSKWVRRMLEQEKAKLFITGSSSKLLSENISTDLRGRSLSFLLFPLSFNEFLYFKEDKVKNVSLLEHDVEEKVRILKLLKEYVLFGGFPEIVLEKDTNMKIRILREYYTTTIYKDVIERFNIENVKSLELLIKSIVSSIGKEFSFTKTHNLLKSLGLRVGKQTLINYFEYLKDAFFAFNIPKYSLSYKEQERNKIYIFNQGYTQIFSLPSLFGTLIENLVALDLLRRKYYYNIMQEIYYYKTKEGYEIDFLIKEGNKIKELIQVTYANSYEEIKEREIRALLHAKEDLNLGDDVPLTVITWDYEDEKEIKWWRKKGRIRFVPLWKWLLSINKTRH